MKHVQLMFETHTYQTLVNKAASENRSVKNYCENLVLQSLPEKMAGAPSTGYAAAVTLPVTNTVPVGFPPLPKAELFAPIAIKPITSDNF